LTTDAPLINTAGRQRMLSQRLAKAALVFLESGKGPRAAAYLDEINEVLTLWSAAHEELLKGDARSWPGGRVGNEVRDGLKGLDPYFTGMQAGARLMIQCGEREPPDLGSLRDGLSGILDNEAEYLSRMDRIVGLYESEARGRVRSLSRISWAVTCLTLASLGAI